MHMKEREKETERVKLGVCHSKQLQIEQPLLCVDFIHLLHRISSEGNISWLKKKKKNLKTTDLGHPT